MNENGARPQSLWGNRGRVTRGFRVLLTLMLAACLWPAFTASAEGGGPYLYVFNNKSNDVTVIDTADLKVLGTRPVGFKTKWLTDNMDSFDGRLLWTYGLRKVGVGEKKVLKVDVVAFDPVELKVVKRTEVGSGPSHSVVLSPDRRYAIMNVAGDDVIAFVEVATGKVIKRVSVGKFPCDMSLTSDGRFAYFPERDQDTVAKMDLATHRVVKRFSFPKGSKPHMNRVAPDDTTLWVQTARNNTNDILDARTLALINTQPMGRVPTTNAWSPDGKYVLVAHAKDNKIIVMDASAPYRQIKRIEVGPTPGVISFHPDGGFAYVTVAGLNAVAVIDMATLKVKTMLPAGKAPWGMVLLKVRPRI